jgi:hypothetical protein
MNKNSSRTLAHTTTNGVTDPLSYCQFRIRTATLRSSVDVEALHYHTGTQQMKARASAATMPSTSHAQSCVTSHAARTTSHSLMT